MTLPDYLKTTKQTQAEFAEKLGKSQTLISAYCREKMVPPRETALRIVEITRGNVTLGDLWHTKIA